MEIYDQICARLDELQIPYKKLEHEPVTTSADAARARGVDLSSGAKALLVKAKEDYSLFVIPGDRQLDWKSVKRFLGSKSARFATNEELEEKTGLVKGSVPPFGNLVGLSVYIDSDVTAQELIRFNGGSLTQSIEMPGDRLAEAVGGTEGYFAT